MKRFSSGILITLVIVVGLIYGVKHYVIKNPIKLFHPLIDFKKEHPILHQLDRIICFTAGVNWYEATELKTGKKYLANITHEGKLFVSEKIEYGEPYDNWYGQGDWIEISREEYFDRFNNGNEVGLMLTGWEYKR